MESNSEIEKELTQKLDELEPKGVLFNSMTYYNETQLNEFLNSMTQEQAIYCLIEACKTSYSRGVFTLIESEAVSRALRTLEP
ncbi:hypothetical protein EBU94_03110 [bacterium]|nr:hypothetical protein [bacterium]